ncbi:uncharacterized protein RBU33_025639 isoform 2-T7 [Hipposideros larvatus]
MVNFSERRCSSRKKQSLKMEEEGKPHYLKHKSEMAHFLHHCGYVLVPSWVQGTDQLCDLSRGSEISDGSVNNIIFLELAGTGDFGFM